MNSNKKICFLISLGLGLLSPLMATAIPEGPAYPSLEWTQREIGNYAKVLEAPVEQVTNPTFVLRLTDQSIANATSLLLRDLADPSWLLASSPSLLEIIGGLAYPLTIATTINDTVARLAADPTLAVSLSLNTPVTPLCTSYILQCAGDPFRYPGSDPFYESDGEVTPVVFYDSGCARLSGRVWKPKHRAAGAKLPGVVIQNGSVEAPETVYWWMAQRLVRAGYVVMTFDPRGQGRSDQSTPNGTQGTNIEPSVFWTGLVDAIDFFRSSRVHPYPNNATCAARYPTAVTAFNPYAKRIDPDRLGIAGHSLGATGVSIVQGYGAPGADAWPGKIDATNPVKAAVAWDSLATPGGGAGGTTSTPRVVPRVPSMGQSSEYGLTPVPFTAPPNPDGHKGAFEAWRTAGVPVDIITVRGSTHYEWSLIPTFPTTSWCPQVVDGQCVGGFGNPLAQHYTLAWMDRWLKRPGEKGYDSADKRLLDDASWVDRYSFYYRSARSFPRRTGSAEVCEDVRAGC